MTLGKSDLLQVFVELQVPMCVKNGIRRCSVSYDFEIIYQPLKSRFEKMTRPATNITRQ